MGGGLGNDYTGLLEKQTKAFTVATNRIFQEEFGRDATPEEVGTVASNGLDWQWSAGDVVIDHDKSKQKMFGTKPYQAIAKTEINSRIATQLKDQLGITDQAQIDKVIDNFDELRLLEKASETGTSIKEALRSVDKVVTNIDNQRQAAVEMLYAGEYGKILEGDNTKLSENLDEYMSTIEGSDFGLDLLMESDKTANKKIAEILGSQINESISGDESVKEILTTKATEAEAATPFGAEEVTAKLNEARDKLATDLAASEGNRAETLRTAYQEYVDTIPGDIAKVKEIAEERLAERLEKLPEQFGEFGARLGLGVGQSGQLQQALAEETAGAMEETERGLQSYQLGRESEASGMKLNLEQQIANYQAQQEQGIAQLGYGIEELGTQIGRQDWQTLLAQQYQQQQVASQQEYNTFLTQMGYQQNQIAQQQQFQQQLGMMYQQQGFQASQSELDRQLQERMFNQQAQLYQQQQDAARKSQKRGSIQSLIGTGVGAGIGSFFGPAGMMIGAGLGGGQPGLTSAGAFGAAGGMQNPWSWTK